jgi:hypothetical protein
MEPTCTAHPAERWLALYLRVQASVLLLALLAVFLPTGWMAAVNDWLGLGEMPRGPLVEYLTRSLSALYAGFGVIYLLLAGDVRRYRPVIRLLGWLGVVFGMGLLGIDLWAGMPPSWVAADGPLLVVLSLVQLGLARYVADLPTKQRA